MRTNKENFRKALNETYSKETLFKLFKKYFLDWIAEGYIGSNLGLFEISVISENTNKQTFLDLLEQFYFKEESFKSAFQTLPKEVQDVFLAVAWNDKFKVENRNIYFQEGDTYNFKPELKDEFLFFTRIGDSKKGEFLTLHRDIIKVIRQFMDKPRDYYIYKADPKNCQFYENNEIIIQENISKYFSFFNDGKMTLSSSGKLLKTCKNDMKKYCNIAEYYSNTKDLDLLKTETIALFMFLFKDEFLTPDYFKGTNLKNIIHGFLSGTDIKSEDNTYIGLYLNYLKGIKNIPKSNDEIKRGLATINKIIEEFPDDGFVSVDNIIKSILYRDEFIEIIDPTSAFSIIYINEANYERTKLIDYDNYLNYIIEPFIKSVFFILASFGILEIHYDYPPEPKSLYLKSGYLSRYDGIKYVGFTNLGRYIFNRTLTYDFKSLNDDSQIILDEDRLIVTILGKDPVKFMILKKIGEKITDNKFKITEESFTKNFESLSEVPTQIQEFKEKVSNDLPKNWESFFETLLSRTTLITHIPGYKVLKLKNNKPLLDTISKDQRFRDLILKGEDFHILVKTEDFQKVCELFQEYGYFINI